MVYEENTTDLVYFEAMLSAIGVVVKKKDMILGRIVENTTKPWKPTSLLEECPY